MRLFLDECVDWRLGRELAGHDVKTARQMGWTTIRNGELLSLAAQHFDVFISVDRGLAFQQNARRLPLSIVVLRAKSNRLADLLPLVPLLEEALQSAKPGDFVLLGSAPKGRGLPS